MFLAAGLGLTISQNLCLALGGQIRCKSEIGQGSVFYFDIKYTLEDIVNKNANNINALDDLVRPNNSGHVTREISPNVLVSQRNNLNLC